MQVQKRIYNYIIEVQNFVFVAVTNGKQDLEKKLLLQKKISIYQGPENVMMKAVY